MRLSLSVGLAFLLAVPAGAHDHWISRRNLADPITNHLCCGAADCRALKDGELVQVDGGWLFTPRKEVIAAARVIWGTEDGKPWRCEYLWHEKAEMIGSTRCLILPNMGF